MSAAHTNSQRDGRHGVVAPGASASRTSTSLPAATGFVLLNVAGGAAVLGSYAWGLAQLGDEASRAWGGVPDGLRPVYQASMVMAAAGYFPMTLFVLKNVRAGRMLMATTLYAGILICSAAWLPLTVEMLEQPSMSLWWAIRLDLAVVGLASLAVVGLIARERSSGNSALRKWALAGAVAFALQTALLDAVVWPAYFPAGS